MELAAASGLERAYVIAATLRAVVEGELGLVEQMTQTAATAHREADRLRHQYALVILEALMVPWLAGSRSATSGSPECTT